MNALLSLDAVELWQIAGWTMVHFLWLGALVAAAAAICRVALRRASPNIRYAFMLVWLLALAVLPLGAAAWLFANSPPMQGGVAADVAITASAPRSAPPVIELHQPEPGTTAATAPATALAAMPTPPPSINTQPALQSNSTSSRSFNLSTLLTHLKSCIPYLPWLWLIGTPITFALLLTGVVGTRRLNRASRPIADGPIAALLSQLTESLRIGRRVTVAVCDRIAAPVLIGILRPVILLPPSALTGWSPDEIEMVLLHELAHVRRWDNLMNLLQRIVESLLFFHPAVWLISSWVRSDREACCDALVVRRTNRPHAYAEMLVALAAQIPRSVLFHPAASSAMAAGPLRSRIRRILQLEDDPMLVSGKSFAALLGSLAVAATFTILYAPLSGQAEESTSKPAKSAANAAADSSDLNAVNDPDSVPTLAVDEVDNLQKWFVASDKNKIETKQYELPAKFDIIFSELPQLIEALKGTDPRSKFAYNVTNSGKTIQVIAPQNAHEQYFKKRLDEWNKRGIGGDAKLKALFAVSKENPIQTRTYKVPPTQRRFLSNLFEGLQRDPYGPQLNFEATWSDNDKKLKIKAPKAAQEKLFAGLSRLDSEDLFGGQWSGSEKPLSSPFAAEERSQPRADNQPANALAQHLLPPVPPTSDLMAEALSKNNMKAISIAALNYEASKTSKSLPPHAIYSADGKPLLSWRVALLPYLGEQELYSQFHLNEPWDSEHNRKLVARIPILYVIPKVNLPPVYAGKTNYLAVVGPECVFDGTAKGSKLQGIPDGTANTIAFVEANVDQAVEWTKPDDWQFDRQHPTKGLGTVWTGHWNAAFVDGSQRQISNNTPADAVGIQFTRAGGEQHSLQESVNRPTSVEGAAPAGPWAELEGGRVSPGNDFAAGPSTISVDRFAPSAGANPPVEAERLAVASGEPAAEITVTPGGRGNLRPITISPSGQPVAGGSPAAAQKQVFATIPADMVNSNPSALFEAYQKALKEKVFVDLEMRDGEFTLVVTPVPKENDWPAMLGELPRKDRVIGEKAWKRLGLKLAPLNKMEAYYSQQTGDTIGIRIVGGNIPKGLPLPSILTTVDRERITSFDQLLTWLESESGRNHTPVRCYAIADGKEYLFEASPVDTTNAQATYQPTPSNSWPPLGSVAFVAPATVNPEELKVLRERVTIIEEQYKANESLYKKGQKGGSLDRVKSAAYELALAEGEVALAEGNHDAAIEKFKLARTNAEEALKAIQEAYKANKMTHDVLLQAIRNVSDIKLKLIRLQANPTGEPQQAVTYTPASPPATLQPVPGLAPSDVDPRELPSYKPASPNVPTPAKTPFQVQPNAPALNPIDSNAPLPGGEPMLNLPSTAPSTTPPTSTTDPWATQTLPGAAPVGETPLPAGHPPIDPGHTDPYAAVPHGNTEPPTNRPTIAAPPSDKSNLRYDGKTFDQWRNVWQTELSTEKRLEGIKALAAFGRAGYGKEATETILDVASEYDFSILEGKDSAEGSLKETVLEALTPQYRSAKLADFWIPEITARVKQDPKKWHWLSVWLFSRLRTDDPKTRAELQSIAASGPIELRGMALSALVNADRSAKPGASVDKKTRDLIDAALESKNAETIRSTLTLLPYYSSGMGGMGGGMGGGMTAPNQPDLLYRPALLPLLLDSDEQVRRQARQVVSNITEQDSGDVIKYLLGVLKGKSRERDHLEAVRGLAAVAKRGRLHMEELNAASELQKICKDPKSDNEMFLTALIGLNGVYGPSDTILGGSERKELAKMLGGSSEEELEAIAKRISEFPGSIGPPVEKEKAVIFNTDDLNGTTSAGGGFF